MTKVRYITTQSILLVFISILALTSSQTPKGSIHINLIYRDSSISPLYNPQESPYDRVRNSFARSKARLSYLINSRGNIIDDFRGKIEVDDGEYFVNFSIGTPPIQLFASMDTASKLVLSRNNNQTMSLTYNNIACNSSKCTLLPKNACDSSNMCSFINDYSDVSRPNSLLGSDILMVETLNGEIFSLKDVIFGYEHDYESKYSEHNGILGLGFHNLSLITQMSSIIEPKFTYCLGNISDPEAENRLVLGNGAFLEGQTTSLMVIDGRYNLVVEGLSIGKRRLLVPPEIFQVNTLGGGVIIDAGTTLTFLAQYAYYQLVGELERELGLVMVLWPNPPYERCYSGRLSDINNFRGVIFHLEGGVNVVSDVPNLFLQVDDGLFCLAVLPSPVGGASVLGSLFQQFYSVGYHLGEMLVSFQRIECKLLEKNLSQ